MRVSIGDLVPADPMYPIPPNSVLAAEGLAGLRGLGLGPDDPCYDPNHPWYMPSFWNSDSECACIEQNTAPNGSGRYTCGQNCVGYGPPGCNIGTVMGNQVGTVVGAAVSTVGSAVGAGVGAAAANTTVPGMLVIGAALVAGLVVLGFMFRR